MLKRVSSNPSISLSAAPVCVMTVFNALSQSVSNFVASVYYNDLGISAEEAFNMMANGAKNGTFQIDYLNDAVTLTLQTGSPGHCIYSHLSFPGHHWRWKSHPGYSPGRERVWHKGKGRNGG